MAVAHHRLLPFSSPPADAGVDGARAPPLFPSPPATAGITAAVADGAARGAAGAAVGRPTNGVVADVEQDRSRLLLR